jgi:ComF family protein
MISLASFTDGLKELLWPARCVGCDELGILLCERCDEELPRIRPLHACPRCGAPYGSIVCTECYGVKGPVALSFSKAVSAFEFRDTAARLTVIYKDQHEHRLAALCALAILEVMPAIWLEWADVITYIPADRRAARKRGFCHMQLVAEQFALLVGLPVACLLRKKAVRDQRKLNREQRTANLAQAFCLAGTDAETNTMIADSITGTRIILLDDVCTTTATLNAASALLLENGAEEVRAATVCRVY